MGEGGQILTLGRRGGGKNLGDHSAKNPEAEHLSTRGSWRTLRKSGNHTDTYLLERRTGDDNDGGKRQGDRYNSDGVGMNRAGKRSKRESSTLK